MMLGRRVSTVIVALRSGAGQRRAIHRSARARIYRDSPERRWSLYGRWLEWFSWRDTARVVAGIAGLVALALINAPQVTADDPVDLVMPGTYWEI